MSNLNFTNTPLQKLLNKRNIFSRVDALEAKDEAPSLTAESLSEITPDAGAIYITEVTNIINNEVIGLPEAPIDGTTYGRKDAAWTAIGAAPVSDYWKSVFVFDEFLGAFQLSVINIYGALNWLAFEDTLIDPPSPSIASPAHPGIMKIRTQSQVVTNSGWILLSVARFAADTFDLVQFIVLCDAPYEAADGVAFGLGYIATVGDFAVDGTMEGIYFIFQYGDTNWSAVTRNASTNTVTDTGVAFSSSAWFFLEIKRTATNVYEFYINRVLVATHTTTIPANLITPVLGMASQTINSFGVNVDYFGLQFVANTQRWT